MRLDGETGLGLIMKALEQERDERIFQQWVVQLPHMEEKNFISLAEYKNRLIGANIDRRPVAEILAELDEVERRLQKGGGE